MSRKRRDRELEAEIQAHLAMATRDRIERGESLQAAELAARREFGNRTLIQELTRETWGWNFLEQLWQDVRYALRGMRRNPGFTAVAVLSLALGIGANTAIFSLINTLMLRMLPVQEPGRLVELLSKYPGEPRGNYFTWSSYEYYQANNHVFSGIIATGQSPFGTDPSFYVRGDALSPERVNGVYVTGNFFSVLGIKAALGRLIGQQDNDTDSPANVAVVSWSYWKNRFNLDDTILGKRITVEDVPVTIIGVTQREFSGLQVGSAQDIWIPVALEPRMHTGPPFTSTHYSWLNLIARLKPGVSMEQARAEMSVLFQWTIEERTRNSKDPLVRQMRFEMEPAGAGLSSPRDQFSKPLLLLMSVVGVLLLITCTNIASMLLARATARQHEIAVRVSLGASRFRLVRQWMTEALLLSAMGSLFGIFVAYFGGGALARILTAGRGFKPVDLQVRPNAEMLLFTAGAAVVTGLLFGLAPAWYAFSLSPASSLRETGRASETRLRRFFGKGLVVTQVALSVVLLSAAGLFVRNLSTLEHVDLGFRRDHVLLINLDPAHSGYSSEQLSGAYQELLGRLEAIPGVRSATIATPTPILGPGISSFVAVEGFSEKPEDRRYISVARVAPKYFATFGIPLLMGRDFSFEDRGRSRVAIVNRTMARYYFGDSSPIGKRVTFDGDDKPYEIVGVTGDSKYYEIREAALRTIYLNTFQFPGRAWQFALRTTVDPEAVIPDVRRTVRELLKTIPIVRVTTLADQVDASIVPERLIATLSGLFGALGSLLAAIGLYGLLAYTVARRINEIGIRMALGATRRQMTRMVLEDALGMVCAGLLIGVPLAFWSRRFAASLIQDLPADSAVPIVFGALAMIVVALLAAYLPARRAARVDPMEALRYE